MGWWLLTPTLFNPLGTLDTFFFKLKWGGGIMTLVLCTPRVMFENSFFKKGLIDIRLSLRFNTKDSLFHLQFNVYFKPMSHSIYDGKAKGGN